MIGLLLAIALYKWIYPAVIPVGPRADTEQAVAELEREVQEIGQLIRERQAAEGAAPTGRPTWPAPGFFTITSEFGSRVHPVLHVPKLHTGTDIGATQGSQAVSTLAGRVILVKMFPTYGQVVVVDHGGRVASVYAHLSAVAVQEGDRVEQGALLGRVGATGQVTGPHLHFEVRQDGEPMDPALYLGRQ